MSALAASPRSVLRQARITRAAPRRTKWRAASSPSPPLAPVTMMVRPAYEVLGTARDRSWLRRKCKPRANLAGRESEEIRLSWRGYSRVDHGD